MPKADTVREGLAKELDELLTAKPDNYTVQNCCICYGGNSFPGPMKDALLCHLEILQTRIKPILARYMGRKRKADRRPSERESL